MVCALVDPILDRFPLPGPTRAAILREFFNAWPFDDDEDTGQPVKRETDVMTLEREADDQGVLYHDARSWSYFLMPFECPAESPVDHDIRQPWSRDVRCMRLSGAMTYAWEPETEGKALRRRPLLRTLIDFGDDPPYDDGPITRVVRKDHGQLPVFQLAPAEPRVSWRVGWPGYEIITPRGYGLAFQHEAQRPAIIYAAAWGDVG